MRRFFVAFLCVYAHSAFPSPLAVRSCRGAQAGGLVSAAGDWLVLHVVARKRVECGLWGCTRSFRGSTDALDVQVVQPGFRVCAG